MILLCKSNLFLKLKGSSFPVKYYPKTYAKVFFFWGKHRGDERSPPEWTSIDAGKPVMEGAWHQVHAQPWKVERVQKRGEDITRVTYKPTDQLLLIPMTKHVVVHRTVILLKDFTSTISIPQATVKHRVEKTDNSCDCIIFEAHPGSNWRPPTPFKGRKPQRREDRR